MASWLRIGISLLLPLGLAILTPGCGTLKRTVQDVILNLNVSAGDYVAYHLSESGVLYVGVGETWSEHDSVRTVLTAFDLSGKIRGKVALPDGYFADAIYADDTGIYCFGQDEGDRSKLLKITLGGSIVWEHEVQRVMRESDSENLKLSFCSDDWRNVQIVSQGDPDELSVVWCVGMCRPENATLRFSRWTGQITGFSEGIRSEAGANYGVFGHGVARMAGKRLDDVLADEDAQWALGYVNGRLVVQGSRDGKTGIVRYVEGSLAPVAKTPLPYPVRHNGKFFYAVDPGRKILRLVRIR